MEKWGEIEGRIPLVCRLRLTYSYWVYIHTENAWVRGGSPIGPIIDELVLKHSTLLFFSVAEICCSAERISRGVVVNHVLSLLLSYLSDVHGAALTFGLFRPGGLVPLSILDDTTALRIGRRSTGTYYRRHRRCPHLRIQQGIALNNAKSYGFFKPFQTTLHLEDDVRDQRRKFDRLLLFCGITKIWKIVTWEIFIDDRFSSQFVS